MIIPFSCVDACTLLTSPRPQAHWNLSLCLFNKIATGRLFTLGYQLLNSRPTKAKRLPHEPWLPPAPPADAAAAAPSSRREPSAAEIAHAIREAEAASRLNSTDPIDGALYAFARFRFWHDVKKHGVSAACCPNYESVEQMPHEPAHVTPECARHKANEQAAARKAQASQATLRASAHPKLPPRLAPRGNKALLDRLRIRPDGRGSGGRGGATAWRRTRKGLGSAADK